MKSREIGITVCTADGSTNPTGWLAAMVECSPEAIFSKDIHGRVVTWNKSAERMFGFSANEIIGQLLTNCLVPSEKVEEERAFLAWLARGERIESFETLRLHKNGQVLVVSVTISPIIVDGEVIGAATVTRDFAADAARRRNLSGAVTELESYTHRMSLGVRGPMRVLRGFLQLVLEDYGAAMPPEGRALLERASHAAERLSMHIEKITE